MKVQNQDVPGNFWNILIMKYYNNGLNQKVQNLQARFEKKVGEFEIYQRVIFESA